MIDYIWLIPLLPLVAFVITLLFGRWRIKASFALAAHRGYGGFVRPLGRRLAGDSGHGGAGGGGVVALALCGEL